MRRDYAELLNADYMGKRVTTLLATLLIPFLLLQVLPTSETNLSLTSNLPQTQFAEENVECLAGPGNSTIDRVGCLDSDNDGYSDPDLNWTSNKGADGCPLVYGDSRSMLCGCPDMDRDWIPDMLDVDIDGDGITNEFELIASTLYDRYDPYDRNSTPPDNDFDLVPDIIDDDDDNDGWPDRVEIDRGSNQFVQDDTPFTMYFEISSGTYYHRGITFSSEYSEEGVELSISALLDIVTEELVIPLLLIPIYLFLFRTRRGHFNRLGKAILESSDFEELAGLEVEVNDFVKRKVIRVYHGLVLRNAIEQRETELRGSEGKTLTAEEQENGEKVGGDKDGDVHGKDYLDNSLGEEKNVSEEE